MEKVWHVASLYSELHKYLQGSTKSHCKEKQMDRKSGSGHLSHRVNIDFQQESRNLLQALMHFISRLTPGTAKH
jgi:hypothetical protein